MRGIDLFCGCGGSTLGLEWAGGKPVAAVNHWATAALTYHWNHGLQPHQQSMADVNPADLPSCDVLLASPECTNHSAARGARPVNEQSRATALEVVRFARQLRPRVVIVENVPEIRAWPAFREWCDAIQGLGYELNREDDGALLPTWGQVLDSSEFGVPQARRRWFLVASRSRRPHVASPRMAPVPVAECIDWSLPTRPVSNGVADSTRRRIEQAQAALGDAPAILVYYGSGPQFMPVDRPCRTLTTRDRFALLHRGRLRMLQPPELLRIQGFPDTYQLAGTRRDKVMLVGNSVCPPVMHSILEQVA